MIVTYTLGIPKNNTRNTFKVLAFALILLGFVTAYILNDRIYWIASGIILLVCGSWFHHLTYSRKEPMSYFAAQLRFDHHLITIDDRVFTVKELQNLKIEINEYDGEIIQTDARRILNGTNNHLSFTHLNEKISLQFYILSEVQKNQFRDLFEAWYINHVPFYEGNVAGRTYLLEHLNYREIQEFKRMYKIS